MKSFFAFIAGFFRQGAAESSTRFVGILCLVAMVGLAYIIVIAMLVAAWLGEAHKAVYDPPVTMITQIGTTLTMLCTTGCVALGLRKSPDVTTTATVETPAASATVSTTAPAGAP